MQELRFGWPDTFVRLRIPQNWAALRYFVRNPGSAVVGVYGFRQHRKNVETILAQQSEIQKLRDQINVKNDRMKAMGKELSALKRAKNKNGDRAGRETACKA